MRGTRVAPRCPRQLPRPRGALRTLPAQPQPRQAGVRQLLPRPRRPPLSSPQLPAVSTSLPGSLAPGRPAARQPSRPILPPLALPRRREKTPGAARNGRGTWQGRGGGDRRELGRDGRAGVSGLRDSGRRHSDIGCGRSDGGSVAGNGRGGGGRGTAAWPAAGAGGAAGPLWRQGWWSCACVTSAGRHC